MENYQKGEGEIWVIIILVIIGFAIWGVISLFQFTFGQVQEGIVNIDVSTCNQVINLKEGDWATYFHKFTCTTSKTTDGRIISGTCTSLDLDSNGKCNTAYTYNETPQVTCDDSNGYVNLSGTCSCNYGYVMKNNTCITNTQDCINKYGKNVYGVAGTDGNASNCYCNIGYTFNQDMTACVSY
ncbi:MAG: hypothetical protein ABSA74_00260 [Candidatus Staskawiczbacteria bacterium]|jgi:hypothetical protein